MIRTLRQKPSPARTPHRPSTLRVGLDGDLCVPQGLGHRARAVVVEAPTVAEATHDRPAIPDTEGGGRIAFGETRGENEKSRHYSVPGQEVIMAQRY